MSKLEIKNLNLAINNRKFGEEKDCSQDKLYKLAGSPINTITKIEVGDVSNPTIDMAKKLLNLLTYMLVT